MTQDKLIIAQQSAIRELTRAKLDREIARPVRQSHRLWNLYPRRRSSFSRWRPSHTHTGRCSDLGLLFHHN